MHQIVATSRSIRPTTQVTLQHLQLDGRYISTLPQRIRLRFSFFALARIAEYRIMFHHSETIRSRERPLQKGLTFYPWEGRDAAKFASEVSFRSLLKWSSGSKPFLVDLLPHQRGTSQPKLSTPATTGL
ncbi:hypothetical protein DACRYDRAFT_20619 [Dacryopinax primogenitus]|uniref:Uncharacterized protein n=1 Tax=Dacryopinax primogenitus (strain DJM 731) TaxID=1858805 RepID=M5GE46_DACPD|nr:uncharacterized protein DACRYDRAFT_20619 [Dacryopinax primogenitus]EJU05072.1 hypothetical protein DACRYDRAFT_20619 [Dacryopinax primogenitus]